MSIPANALDITQAGLVKFDGNYTFTGVTVTPYAPLIGSTSNNITSLTPLTDGQLIIGSTGNNPSPASITSAGGSITVTPGAGTLNLEAGASVPTTFATGSGSAVPAANTITFTDGNNITMSGAGSAVTVGVSGTTDHAIQLGNATGSLTSATALTNGQLLIGSTGADPSAASITSTGSTITVSGGAGTLNLETGSAVATSFQTSSGTAVPASGVLTLTNGTGITMSGAGSAITVGVNGSVVGQTITGDSGGALSPTAGNWTLSGGVNMVTSGATSTMTFRSDILDYVQPGAYPYTALDSDYFISVDTSAARTINLPNAPTTGKSYVIKDRVGSATANNISVTTPGGTVTIDGSTTYAMNLNYGSINVIFNGTNYEVW